MRMSGRSGVVVYDNEQLLCNHTSVVFRPWHYLLNVQNRSIRKTAMYHYEGAGGDREDREQLSQQFDTKYILAVMNSSATPDWFAARGAAN